MSFIRFFFKLRCILIFVISYRVIVIVKEFVFLVFGKCIMLEIVGVLWEWFLVVSGSYVSEELLEWVKVWCMDSYVKFVEMVMSVE